MNDVVAEVEESRRGAVVRFESGERLWFCRGAWLNAPRSSRATWKIWTA